MNPKSPMRLTMKAFLPASAADWLGEPESDEQIGTEADAFPADEHHREVGAQHQHEHERSEQIQVREVARELPVRLVVHVRRRVQVDERADARHDEHHDRAERVQPERHRHLQRAGCDPHVEGLFDRAHAPHGLDLRASSRPAPPRRRTRRPSRRSPRQSRHELRQPATQSRVDQEADERKQRNQVQHAVTTSTT